MKLIERLKRKILTKRNPTEYYRSLGVKMGEGCEIYSTANFGSEPYLITLGNHVRIAHGVSFVTHDGGVWVLRGMYEELCDIDKFGPITVGDNVHIGMNAFIMPGVKIGSNCIIGCGAIVTHDVPDGSVAVGVPARVIETVEEYLEKNKNAFEHTKKMSAEEKKRFLNEKYNGK